MFHSSGTAVLERLSERRQIVDASELEVLSKPTMDGLPRLGPQVGDGGFADQGVGQSRTSTRDRGYAAADELIEGGFDPPCGPIEDDSSLSEEERAARHGEEREQSARVGGRAAHPHREELRKAAWGAPRPHQRLQPERRSLGSLP
jgi:hypothetical protein